MPTLRTNNFQGATIEPIVRDINTCLPLIQFVVTRQVLRVWK